jgi:hypothetical protein
MSKSETMNTGADQSQKTFCLIRASCIGICVWFTLIAVSYYTVPAFIPALCLLGSSITGLLGYKARKLTV